MKVISIVLFIVLTVYIIVSGFISMVGFDIGMWDVSAWPEDYKNYFTLFTLVVSILFASYSDL